jgi:predicted amidohydrolase YtcJ
VLSGSKGLAGPPYRLLLDSGIHVGAGMDGAQASPINPWLHVYYMVTGKNVRGEVINDGQQITRQEAVWLYTGANGWFSREEDTLGTIEAGRLADLVVLNADVSIPRRCPTNRLPRPRRADDPRRPHRYGDLKRHADERSTGYGYDKTALRRP